MADEVIEDPFADLTRFTREQSVRGAAGEHASKETKKVKSGSFQAFGTPL